MKQLFIGLCCVLSSYFTSAIAQNSPYIPAGYILTFADEFDGTSVNTNDWYFRTDARWDGLNLANNVRLEGGKLYIDFKYEPQGVTTYTGGGIITKHNYGYGYYEVSSKLFGATGGLHSSFWLMGNGGNGTDVPKLNTVLEIDGYEVDSHVPSKISSNLHYYIGSHISPSGAGGSSTTINSSTEYFTYGFEWTPNYIKWYKNGILLRTFNNPSYYAAQNLWLTSLGGTHFTTAVDKTKLPGSSEWEYFRYYAKDMSGFNWVGNSGFEYNKPISQANVQYPVAWCESGNVDASLVDTFATAYSGKGKLRHFATSAYSVKTTYNLDYIPNGIYTMKAWVRSSGGQSVAQLIATNCGDSSFTANIPQLSTWTQILLSDIKVENNRCTIGFNSIASESQWIEMDNVEFIQTNGGVPEPPVTSNVIKDSSFNLNYSNTYNPTTADLGWSSFANFKTGEFVSSKITETNGNNFYRCTTSIALDDYNHALSQYTSKILSPGKYKLSLRTKGDAGEYYLKLSTKTTPGAFLPTNLTEASSGIVLNSNRIYITPTTDWQDYSCVFDLNFTSDDYLRVFFQFHNKGTYDIDDVQLTPYTPPTSIRVPKSDFVIFGRNGSICVSGDVPSGTLEIYSITGLLLQKINVQKQGAFPFEKGIYPVKLMNGKTVLKVSKVIV